MVVLLLTVVLLFTVSRLLEFRVLLLLELFLLLLLLKVLLFLLLPLLEVLLFLLFPLLFPRFRVLLFVLLAPGRPFGVPDVLVCPEVLPLFGCPELDVPPGRPLLAVLLPPGLPVLFDPDLPPVLPPDECDVAAGAADFAAGAAGLFLLLSSPPQLEAEIAIKNRTIANSSCNNCVRLDFKFMQPPGIFLGDDE